jgi:predicted dehydrogenase
MGIIGAGRMAAHHAQSLQHMVNARLTAVYDVELTRAGSFVRKFGGEPFDKLDDSFFDRVDGVVIAAPTEFHHSHMLSATHRGKHILCEKPIAINLEEADEMITKAKKAGVVFMVGHVARFQKEMAEIKEKMDQGFYGSPVHYQASRLSGLAINSWKNWIFKKLGALDIHIHDIDFIYWIFGKKCTINSRGVFNSEGDLIHVTSLVDYENVYKASAEGSFMMPPGFPFMVDLRITLEKACIHFHDEGKSYGQVGSAFINVYKSDGQIEAINLTEDRPVALQMEYFCGCIEKEILPQKGKPEDARSTLELALAAKESLSKRQPVKVT